VENGNPNLEPGPESRAIVEDTAAIQDPAELLSAVAIERDQLVAEKAALEDLLLRHAAEFDNFRRRQERERAETIGYAGMETARLLLPVLDDFERALKAAPEAAGAAAELLKGIELIYQRQFEILKKLGLEPIDSIGRTFDPQVHHAVEMVESEEAGDQTVLDEYQKGYNFKGRLLRPAMVRVAVKR